MNFILRKLCVRLFVSVFIHTISGNQSTVKSRMLYSSCKAALLTRLEREFGITFDHRVRYNFNYLLHILFITYFEPLCFLEILY
ncbi:unnamed protein product [Schistosoma mattheei]|uniref:Uncharacterized protein n=1 Tax=Schistosoma mattheei TaxID=31246 RepID=A0A183NLF2_9TREM|nr:unnamed protein product [Schistosoma mattheei]